jgi:TrmH family RNA methyltransferase
VETTAEVLTSLADTETPQGVIFLCALPDTVLPDTLAPGRYLVLDGVQDPGNLGTIWRTADALGAAGLLLTGACADPFGPKTVRSTMGACFRLPVWRGERGDVKALLDRCSIPLYATALREDTRDIREADLSHAAVVIGSEGRGVSAELLAQCEMTLKIPMTDRCESLNAAVAASIVLWEGWRQSL